MPVTVTMHACSTCPVSVDFTVFGCYLAGYSVEETVEHLMSLRDQVEETPSGAASAATHSPLSTPVTLNAGTSAAAGPPRSTWPPTAPSISASALQHEDGRQDVDESPSTVLPVEETLDVATLVENASLLAAGSAVYVADTREDEGAAARAAGEGEQRQSIAPVDGDRRLPREAARAPTVVPPSGDREHGRPTATAGDEKSRSGRRKGRHGKSRQTSAANGATAANGYRRSSHSHSHSHGATSPGAALEDPKERRRRRATSGHRTGRHREPKSRSFFLNEGYLKFQQRLQQVEGGPSSGAPLSSDLLFLETTEQYRLYDLFIQEEFLSSPYSFLAKHYLPIPAADRLQLVQRYYEVDAAVFRYFFGDRMQKFEAIDTSHVPAATGEGASGGSGTASVGSVSSMLFRWAMRDSHNEEEVAYLLHINTASLKRQWENIKRVCTTMVSLYLAKSDMYVPRGVSLLEAIQQCYAVRGEVAARYTTAVFGYHHRLTTRLLDALHDFSGYSTLCNIIASQWCDQTLLLLDECFVDRCRRIGKLLDESRVLAEVHQLMFGEALRPRWQVQLDEVQRVITTNSAAVEKNSAAAAAAAAAFTNMMTSPSPPPPGVPLPSHAVSPHRQGSDTLLRTGAESAAAAPLQSSPQGPPLAAPPVNAFPPAGHARGSPSRSPNAAAAAAAAAGMGAGAMASQHSPLCANKQFSRRFMYEFPHMMRHLSKVALHIGANTSINDALETFYVRIYAYLEGMSSRTAPAVASMVMSTAAAAAAAAAVVSAVGSPPTSGNKPFGPAAAATASASGAASLPIAKSHAQLSSTWEEPHPPNSGGSPGGAANWNRPRNESNASALTLLSSKPLLKVSSVPTFSFKVAAAAALSSSSTAQPAGVPSRDTAAATPRLEDAMAAANPITTVVNTSMSHPVTSLLPLSSLVAQQQAIGGATAAATAGAVGGGGGSGGGHGVLAAWDEAAGTAAAPFVREMSGGATCSSSTPPLPPVPAFTREERGVDGGVGGHDAEAADSSQTTSCGGGGVPFNPAVFGDVMVKALDKRYLRELSMFLSALPRAWRQAHSLSSEDHAACDDAFSDFIIALKAVTQIIMAADDFH